MRRLTAQPERLARWRAIVAAAVLLCGLLVTHAACAVELPIAILGKDAGLDKQDIRVFHQDRDGYVWAGTDAGLYVFDGVGFLRMGAEQGFKPAAVVGMVEDASGDLWVATQAGMQVRHRGRFASIPPEGRSLLADRGQPLALRANGDLLVVSQHRLLVVAKQGDGNRAAEPLFTAQQRQQDPSLDRIGIVAVQGATIWFSCGDGLCSFQQGRIRHFGTREGVPADIWQGILPARDGSVWVLGQHELLQQAAGASAFVEQHLPDGQSWVAGAGGLLAQDADGRLVVGTKTGLLRLEGSRWKAYGNAQGIMPGNPILPISTVLADRDGGLWLGNPGWGVLHWVASTAVQNWTSWAGWQAPEHSELRRIDALTLWQSDGNVPPSHRGNWRWPLTSLPPDHAYLERITPDGSTWRFHFDGKITRRAPGASHATDVAALKNFIRGVLLSREGTFWIYTLGGVDALNPETGVVKQGENFPMGTSCSDVVEDAAGHIWAACNTGLFLHERQWNSVPILLAGNAGTATITPERMAITADGRMWLGTSDARLLVSQSIAPDALIVQPVEAAMQDSVRVDFIEKDARGWLWVGDAAGLRVFDGARWERLTSRDGLLLDDAGDLAFHADDDSSVWISMKMGLSHLLDPASLLRWPAWQSRVFAADYGGVDLQADAVVPFDEGKAATFHLAVTGNSMGHPVRYRYRLDGVDKDWRETAQRSVSYTIDRPGTYRLEAQAVDTNFPRRTPQVTFEFTLVAPWWRSAWMALLAVLPFLLAGIVLAWRWRSAVLIARNRQLEQTVDRRTAQLKLALHARNDLLARISHDLRSPLANVVECVNRWRAGDAQRDYPRIIEQSVWQQIGLIDDLLEFAQSEHADAELEEAPGYLQAFLAEIAVQGALMAERGGNRFAHRFSDGLPDVVRADFRRLRRVLLNLLGNAAKFTHEGLIEFEVATGQGETGRARLHFTVRDNGIGISSDRIESLLEPFVRGSNVERHEGKGLGLSIVAHWLDRMHSRLQARRLDTGGSEFSFVVDFDTAGEAEVGSGLLDDDPMDASLDGDGQAIVVVDDQPQNRDMLCDLLDSYGFASFPASDGVEALRIVAAQRPAMVVTDQYMDGMDGWALLAALRKTHAGLPVILCSAAPPRRPAGCASVDFDAALLKPVSVRQLLRVIAGKLPAR